VTTAAAQSKKLLQQSANAGDTPLNARKHTSGTVFRILMPISGSDVV
jgi:hypothetical protein